MRGVGDRDDGRAGGNKFAGLDIVREHHACQRRDQPGVVHLGAGEGQRGAGLVHPGAALGDILGARPLPHELEAFGGFGGAGLGDLELGLRRLEFAVGDGILAAQFRLPGKVEPGAIAIGFGAAERGLGGGDFLGTRAGDERSQGGFGAGKFGLAQRELFLLLRAVEPGDQLAGLDAVAL